jgi:hypothetical protein
MSDVDAHRHRAERLEAALRALLQAIDHAAALGGYEALQAGVPGEVREGCVWLKQTLQYRRAHDALSEVTEGDEGAVPFR